MEMNEALPQESGMTAEVAPETVVETPVESGSLKEKFQKLAEKVAEPAKVEEVKEVKEEAAPVVAEKPAYQPNFKVKAYDNEYEIPESFRSFINEQNEKEFREVFEKAYALEGMKEKLHKTRQENETFKKDVDSFNTLRQNLSRVSKYVENGDYDMFFDSLKIPESAIQKWVLSKLQQKELPPEQQAIYNKSNEERRKLYELEQRNEQLSTQFEQFQEAQRQQAVQQTFAQLDTILGKPEVNSVASQFDASVGKAGAFREEVLRRASIIYQTEGRDLTPEEAVNDTLRVIAWNQANQQSGAQAPAASAQPKPVLPNVQGKATSPVSKQVKSLDDLKKMREQILQDQRAQINY